MRAGKPVACPALPADEEVRCSRPGCSEPESGYCSPPLCEQHEVEAAERYALANRGR